MGLLLPTTVAAQQTTRQVDGGHRVERLWRLLGRRVGQALCNHDDGGGIIWCAAGEPHEVGGCHALDHMLPQPKIFERMR